MGRCPCVEQGPEGTDGTSFSLQTWPGLAPSGGQEGPGFSMGVVAPAPAELVAARSGQPKAEVDNREEPAGHHHCGRAEEDRVLLLECIY